MKKFLLVIVVFSMMTSLAFAGTVRNNAGCGVGTLLMETVGKPNGGWVLQTTAFTTNGILSNTFTMSTGTMNCRGHINKDNLAKDIAMGQGDTINSLGSMLAVSDVDAFASRLQSNFGEIFPSADVQSDSVANKIIALS